MSLKGKCAIAGVGVTRMGPIFGRSDLDFAAEAIKLALDDAGLKKEDLDGLMVTPGFTSSLNGLSFSALGFHGLNLVNQLHAFGSSAGAMVMHASMAIDAGIANVIACVFADATVTPENLTGDYTAGRPNVRGMAGLTAAYGQFGAVPSYALAARRHMHLYGTTSRQLGAVAVATRAWAAMNPLAQFREPITIEDHQNSPLLVDPFHTLDHCVVTNGGIAFIVTSSERARTLRQPPAYILGVAQVGAGDMQRAEREPYVTTGAVKGKERAFRMAGIETGDVDVCEIYDNSTYNTIVALEDYGFCKKGEGGPFVEDGKLGPGGSLPTNTNGGQLSAYYMWGMTPLSEGIVQARGTAGERQVKKHDIVLVNGTGGLFHLNSTVILSPLPS